jgi:hypothetical protein
LEPDTYVPKTFAQDLSTNWKFSRVKGGDAESKSGFDDSKWATVDTWSNQHMDPNTDCVLRKTFTVDDASQWNFLDLGAIDDEGLIYVNGKLIKTTTVWNETYQFKTEGLLKNGENTIVVFVHNNDGDGGFSKGAGLSGMSMPVAWSRSLFNGCAQVIVQSTGPGKITLHAKLKDKKFSQVINAK